MSWQDHWMTYSKRIKDLSGLMTVKRPLTSWRNNSQKNQSWWCPIIQGHSRNRCFKVCYRSSTHSVRLQWQQTPHLLYFKNPFPNWMKLWNLWSRTTSYYLSTRRMASLYSRICPYNNNPIRSQELDVLPRSQETKPTASTMVLIPIVTTWWLSKESQVSRSFSFLTLDSVWVLIQNLWERE